MSVWEKIPLWIEWSAGITAGVHFALGAGAVFQSILEKEKRAALGFSVIWILSIPMLWLVFMSGSAFRMPLLSVYDGIAALFLLFILIPLPAGRTLRWIARPEPVDERDAVFHRFYRLEKGTREWRAYYQDHPELQETDARIHQTPQLQKPGSASFDPVTSPFSHAAFDLIGPLKTGLDEPDFPVPDPIPIGPEEATGRLTGLAGHLGAACTGTTRLNPAWIYSHNARGSGKWGAPVHLDHDWALVIAVPMSQNMIQCAPENPVITESAVRYAQIALIARVLERTLRRWGYEARSHVDSDYRVMCIPVAVDAGLGEIGRHGLLITPRYGPLVKLAVVTTSLPLQTGKPVYFGVRAFCKSCRKCVRNCPSGAISKTEPQPVNGVIKWQIDRNACYRYWRQKGTDCGLCLRVCPYARPDTGLHRLFRRILQRNRLLVKPAVFLDDLFYGKKIKRSTAWPKWHTQSAS